MEYYELKIYDIVSLQDGKMEKTHASMTFNNNIEIFFFFLVASKMLPLFYIYLAYSVCV